MPSSEPNLFQGDLITKIFSLGAKDMINPRVEKTYENEWTSGFCECCASTRPTTDTNDNNNNNSVDPERPSTAAICCNSICCHHCTLAAITLHLISFEDIGVKQMLQSAEDNPTEMCFLNCFNRSICCGFCCMDLFAFSTGSTISALQVRHGVRKRYKIKESCCKSFAACLCPFLSIRQMQHEIWIHGELRTGGALFKTSRPPPASQIIPLPEEGEAERIEAEIRLRTAQALAGFLSGAADRMENQHRRQQQRRHEEQEARRNNRRRVEEIDDEGDNTNAAATQVSPRQPPRGYESEPAVGTVVGDQNENSHRNHESDNNHYSPPPPTTDDQNAAAAVGVPVME